MTLKRLMYISTSTQPADANQLLRMCADFAVRNASRNVTGLLVRQANHYFQVLEGDSAVVEELAEKIARDPRHGDFQILHEAQIEARSFADWSMRGLQLDQAYTLTPADRQAILSCVAQATDAAQSRPMAVRDLLGTITTRLAGR